MSLSGDAGDELFCGYERYPLTANMWKRLSVVPLPLRRSMAWLLTRFAPESLNRMAIHTPLARRWANVGETMHKGAGVMTADSVGQLYKRMVSHWSHPEQMVGVPSRVPCLMA